MSLGKRLKNVPGLSSAVWHVDHLFDVLHDLQRHQRDSASDTVLLFEALERTLLRLADLAERGVEGERRTLEVREQVEELRVMLTRIEGQFAAHLRGIEEQFARSRLGVHVPALSPEESEPEPSLLQHLAAELQNRTAIDVGAHVGALSQRLHDAGLEVFALEPAPDAFQKLTSRFAHSTAFHALPVAAGAEDCEADLHIAEDTTEDQRYAQSTPLLASLTLHSMFEGVAFRRTVRVTVRRIETLIREGRLPASVGILKTDTEGVDLDVVTGLGPLEAEIVQVEYWDPEFVFGRSGARNHLKDTVPALRARGYARHLVIARPAQGPVVYYANLPVSIPGSWGNAIFFRDEAAFQAAKRWCEAVLTPAYLYR